MLHMSIKKIADLCSLTKITEAVVLGAESTCGCCGQGMIDGLKIGPSQKNDTLMHI